MTKAWKRDEDSRQYVGPPKRKRARRTISLLDELVDVLLPLLAIKASDELLFPNTVGQWLSSSPFWTSTWTPALDAACHPVRPDGTPDPDAPRLLVLQRRLGHESITTTTETHAHLMPDQQELGQALATTPEQTVLDLARLDPRNEDVDVQDAIDALWPLCDSDRLGEIVGRHRMKATYARVAAGR